MSNFWKKNDGLNVKNDKHDICPLCKLQSFPSCYKNDFIKFKYGINYKTTYAKNHALEILPNNKIISIGGYKSKKVLIQTENIITKKCPDIYIERCNFYSCIHYDGTIIIWGGRLVHGPQPYAAPPARAEADAQALEHHAAEAQSRGPRHPRS